jgi:endogenous inhibitor of DNA gyrase (YacG/DUF329 family)
MTKLYTRCCAECGKEFQAKRVEAEFCSSKCKGDFNNRRAARGAILYDLMMVNRNERGLAKMKKVWFLVTRLLMYWREEDVRQRDGRRSWQKPEKALDAVSWASSTVVARNYRAGR